MTSLRIEERPLVWAGPSIGIGLGLSLAVALAGGASILLIPQAAAAIGAGLILAVWIIVRPHQGFYVMLAAVIVVEGASSMPFVKEAMPMYQSIGDFAGPLDIPLSPLELVLLVLLWAAYRQASDVDQFRSGEFLVPLLLMSAGLLMGLARGVGNGGDFSVAFHEVRALLFLPVVYLVSFNLMRERPHFVDLSKVLVLAVGAMAAGTLWTHFTVVRPGKQDTSLDVLFLSHENALFAGLLVVFAAALLIWGRGQRTRFIAAVAGLLALAALLVLKRRAGVIALDAGLLLMGLVLLRQNFRLFLVVMPIVLLFSAIYLAMYWDSTGSLSQGARSFRTAIGQESQAEDISSEEYRAREAFNVEFNIRSDPVLGLGFGNPYAFPAPLPDLTGFWSFQRYIPHNTVLWVWMKGGIVAFVLLLGLVGHATMRGAAVARSDLEPLLRAWAIAAAAAIPMVFLFGWQDLGLSSPRVTLLLGLCLGLIAAIGSNRQPDTDRQRRVRQSASRSPANQAQAI